MCFEGIKLWNGHTPDTDNFIRENWGNVADGKMSASQIAKVLGTSKGVVMGRAHRLGVRLKAIEPYQLEFDFRFPPKPKVAEPAPVKKHAVKKKPTKKKPIKNPKPNKQAKVESVVKTLEPVDDYRSSYWPLRADHLCRWPIGEPKKNLTWCDNKREPGRPYCSTHHNIAFVPLSRRHSWAESGD